MIEFVVFIVSAILFAPLIALIVAVITGDFDFFNTRPERRDVYWRWRS